MSLVTLHELADPGCRCPSHTLEPLRRLGPDALDVTGILGLRQLRLCELEIAWDNAQANTLTLKACDLFQAAVLDPHRFTIPETGKLVRARFRLLASDSPRPRSVQLCPPNQWQLANPADTPLVTHWLALRGFQTALN